MTKLQPLRSELRKLQSQRRLDRWLVGGSALVLAVVGALAILFLADWGLSLTALQRFVAMAAMAGAVAWVTRRYALPLFRQQESEIDVALLVEKRQNIDSDLVAGLQFESPQASAWGSTQLRQTVVDQVATTAAGRNLRSGFSRQPMLKSVAAAAAPTALALLLIFGFPAYARPFFHRLLMGRAHYPTWTVIESVVVNDQPVKDETESVSGLFGQPAQFEVCCFGVLPDEASARLRIVSSGDVSTVTLTRRQSDRKGGVYVGGLPRQVETMECTIFAGDASVGPVTLVVFPPPAIKPEIRVTPPSYVKPDPDAAKITSARQISVAEGSRVDFDVVCANAALREAGLVIEQKTYPLEAVGKDGRRWRLPPTSPLADVQSPIAYSIQVVDEHGISPAKAITGEIQIKPDSPPRVRANVVAQYFQANAKPVIRYHADDDIGIAQVLIHVQQTGSDEKTATIKLPLAVSPALSVKLPVEGDYALDLSQYKLNVGDQIKLTLEATDYRGQRPGKSTTSSPILISVTNESGILRVLRDEDRKTLDSLDRLILEQFKTGGMR